MHFAHEHLALRDRRLEPRLLRGALLGDVAGDEQQLVGRLRRPSTSGTSARPRRAPCRRGAKRYSRVVTSLAASAFSSRAGAAAASRAGRICSGVLPSSRLGRAADRRGGDVVGLDDREAARIEQGDRQRRRLDDPAQRRLRRRHRRLGLATALDVEEREGELAPGRRAAGGDGVADDPELASVAGANAALEGLGLALRRARRGSRCGGTDARLRASRRPPSASPMKSTSSPPNMRRAERFIHSMPRLPDGDDADQHRVEDRARALAPSARARGRAPRAAPAAIFSRVTSDRTAIASSKPVAPPARRTESEYQRRPGRRTPLPSSRSPLDEPASMPSKANSVS